MNKLLEQAKRAQLKIGRRVTPISKDEIELAVAYIKGEISRKAGADAVGTTEAHFASFAATAVKRGFEAGMVKLEFI